MDSQDENVPYRATIASLPAAAPVSSKDENNYDTLKDVHARLAKSIEDLYTDFNAFEVHKDLLPANRAKMLLHDVEVRQGVYDIVLPLLQTLESALESVNGKYRER